MWTSRTALQLGRVALAACVAAIVLPPGTRAQGSEQKPPLVEQNAPAANPQPATQPQPFASRRMLWDRTRIAADLARRETKAKQALKEAEARAEREPGDPLAQQVVAAARNRLEEVRQANAKERLALAGELTLEKAAYLGIASSPADPVLRKQLKLPAGVGLVVDYVEPNSPAATAGLEPYDVATRLDGQVLVNPQQLAVLVRTFEPGTQVTLEVVREGKPTAVKVRLVEREVKPLADVNFGAENVRREQRAWLAAGEAAATPGLPVEEGPLKAGDMLRVTIYDLVAPGVQTVQMSRVGRKGEVHLPYLDEPVRAEGLTDRKLADAIRKAYQEAKVLKHPLVNVQRALAAPPGLKNERMLDELPVKVRK